MRDLISGMTVQYGKAALHILCDPIATAVKATSYEGALPLPKFWNVC